eukprot:183039_1
MLVIQRYSRITKELIHHSSRYFTANVKFHKFETIVREREIESIPVDDPVTSLVQEMKQFVDEFNTSDNMEEFFTRKSEQNVLSVVQCFRNDEYLYFRGRNIEVSLPSGTLCAERSAIGNATSNNLDLHRKHFKRIAVIDPEHNIIGLEPCGVCKEYLQKFQQESPEFCIITFPDAEFKSIYEYFPANYPVENVDAEKTQESLEKQWICHACNAANSGYSKNCYLCGYVKNYMKKKYSMFDNPTLTLNMVNAIYDNFYPDKPFTYRDLSGKLNMTAYEHNVVNSILFHLASPKRKLLYRKSKLVFKTDPESFQQYKDSLTKNLLANQ